VQQPTLSPLVRLPDPRPTGAEGDTPPRPADDDRPPRATDISGHHRAGQREGDGHPDAATEQHLGLRERKKRATRRELERVAFDLFLARGFDGVTVDDITAAAHVSKRTFYRYFESKEDVLLSDQRRQLDALRLALDGRPTDEALLTSVREAFLHMADQYAHGREVLTERTRLIMVTPSLASRAAQHHILWERSLAEMIAGRLELDVDADLRPRLAAATLLAALRVTLDHWLTGDEPLAPIVDRSLRTLAELFGPTA
jgi:AcrR family transcriptional regulator